MQMLNHYSNLVEQVASRMYEGNDEYMHYSYEEALPRITALIMNMTMREMLEFVKEETTDADIKRFTQTNPSHSPICFGWLRLGTPAQSMGHLA